LLGQLKGNSFEIIYVNDGSNDSTEKFLQEFYRKNPNNITIIALYARSGKAAAQQIGISHAKGKYIVFMDGDSQDDPKDIFALLETLKNQNADMVVGWRKKRQSPMFYRYISFVFNFIIKKIIGLNIRDINASLKIVKAIFLKDIPLYAAQQRLKGY